MLQLSVIIVNYNVRVFLENALHGVQKALSGLAGEVIVVDNASDDGSAEMVRQKFPEVQLVVSDRNIGFAAANNRAIKMCRGAYILLLNPDTLVQENTFRTMIDFFERNPDVGLAGCKILNPDGTLQLPCRRSFPSPWVAFTKIAGLSTLCPRSKLFGRYNLTYRDPDQTYDVDAVSGSFMFVRRSVIDQVGELDEQFFMYGEDLDWCYRIKQAGWRICYVHSTEIIHYKGESARRSDIDETKLFYEAMRLFVRKHINRGRLSDMVLWSGIAARQWIASLVKISKPLVAVLTDIVLVDLSLIIGERVWFGTMFHFPSSALPVIYSIPAITVVTALSAVGVYTKRKLSITRTGGGVTIGFLLVSAFTFFFKQYGFSRMIVLLSGLVSLLLLPAWRLLMRFLLRSPEYRRKSLFGKRTIIVGVDPPAEQLLRKLRNRVDDGYAVVGFVDTSHWKIGERIAGVEILGSIDNIGKVIRECHASEVIFSTDVLTYAEILSVISRSRNRSVNYRLVPSSLEVIIGKTHIDELNDIPLVDIEYNIDRLSNRITKRTFDIICALALLTTMYPFALLNQRLRRATQGIGRKIALAPRILRGEMSMVGPPESSAAQMPSHSLIYWGKPGLTGIVQVNYHEDLTTAEIEKYNLYYAKNQSLLLDFEILLKSIIVQLKRK